MRNTNKPQWTESSTTNLNFPAALRRARARVLSAASLAAAIGLLLGAAATPVRAVDATYKCTVAIPIAGTKTFTSKVSITGSTPSKVTAGGTVDLTGFQCSITIPADLINDLISEGASTLSGKITVFDVTSTDADSTTVNAAGASGFAIPTTTLVKNKSLVITVPNPAVKAGSWTAKKKGTMHFKSGDITLTLRMSLNGSAVDLTETCVPSPAATISETTVDKA